MGEVFHPVLKEEGNGMSASLVVAVLSLIATAAAVIVSIARFFYDIGKDIGKGEKKKPLSFRK